MADQVLSLATIKDRVAAVIRRSPDKPVLVWGDRAVPYGEVVTLMAALQEAGRHHERGEADGRGQRTNSVLHELAALRQDLIH